MATLAANIPQSNDPEYLRYSHPIGNIEPNKAGYILGKGIGEALEEAPKLGDKVVGQIAENTAFDEGQRKNEEISKIVDPLYQQIVKGEQPNNESSINQPLQFAENQPSLLGGQGKDLPPEITNGVKQATSLNERFKNGKITETDYDAEIAKTAKDLNSKFPAWRSQIATGLQKATGRDNANLSIAEKIRDINTILGQLGQTKQKVQSEIMSAPWKDPQTGAKVLDLHNRGLMSDNEAMYQVFKEKATKNRQEELIRQVEVNKGLRGENEANAIEQADKIAQLSTSQWFNGFSVKAGWKTPAAAEQGLFDLVQHPDDVKAQELGKQFALAIPMYRRELTAQFSKLSLTPSQRAQLVDTYAKPFEEEIGNLTDPTKVASILYGSKHMADAMQRRQEGVVSMSEFGQESMGIKAIQNLSGDAASKIFTQQFMSRPDFTEKSNELLKSFKYRAVGSRPEDTGAPAVSDEIVRSHGFNPNPKVADDYINFLKNIKDVKDPNMARSIAYAYYGPKNIGLVSNWSRNTVDAKGNTYSGQINVLQKLADPATLDTIKKIGDPKLNDHVKNLLENAFTSTVFPGLMQDVGEISKSSDRLGYDDVSHRFHFDPLPGRASAASALETRTVNRLNFALESLQHVGEFSGVPKQDMNGYLIGLIMANNPAAFTKQVSGFPAEINKAISNSVLIKQQKEEEQAARQKALQAP